MWPPPEWLARLWCLHGLSREQKVYEISKEILVYGSTVVVFLLYRGCGFTWPQAGLATIGSFVFVYITASVLVPRSSAQSRIQMVQNSKDGNPPGVLTPPPTAAVPDGGDAGGDQPTDPGPLGSSGLRQP